MSKYKETLNQLIKDSENYEWLHKQLNKLKQEIQDEIQSRPSS
jgi:macrodomain Ter protein organizer (MatP/YcbG family)